MSLVRQIFKYSDWIVLFITCLSIFLVMLPYATFEGNHKNSEQVPRVTSVNYYFDESFALTIDDIIAMDKSFFSKSAMPTNFGHTNASIWLKLVVEGQEFKNDRWFLNTGNSFVEKGELYKIDEGEIKIIYDHYDIAERNAPYDTRYFISEISLKAGEPNIFFLRYETKMVTHLHFLIQNLESILIDKTYSNFIYGFFFALIIFLTVLNINLYFEVKEKYYLYYAIQQSIAMVVLFLISGGTLGNELYMLISPVNKLLAISHLLFGLVSLLYIYSLLDFSRHYPSSNRVIWFCLVATFFIIVCVFIPITDVFILQFVLPPFTILMWILILLFIFLELKNRNPIAIMCSFAVIFSFVFFVFYVIGILDIGSVEFVRHEYLPFIGLVIQAVFFSRVMRYQLNDYRIKAEQAHFEIENIFQKRIAEVEEIERLNRDRVNAVQEKILNVKHLASTSHDIHQHLLLMRMNLNKLKSKSMDEETISRFVDAMTYVEGVTGGILKVAKEDAQIKNLLDIKSIFSSVHQNMQALSDQNRVDLRSYALPVKLAGSEIILRRILENLVKNAIHSSKGGKVMFAFRYYESGYKLEVRDNGKGMNEHQLIAMEQAFERGESAHYKGFGLGLYIVYSLCAQAGYELSVKSKPNKGSTFTIVVPI